MPNNNIQENLVETTIPSPAQTHQNMQRIKATSTASLIGLVELDSKPSSNQHEGDAWVQSDLQLKSYPFLVPYSQL